MPRQTGYEERAEQLSEAFGGTWQYDRQRRSYIRYGADEPPPAKWIRQTSRGWEVSRRQADRRYGILREQGYVSYEEKARVRREQREEQRYTLEEQERVRRGEQPPKERTNVPVDWQKGTMDWTDFEAVNMDVVKNVIDELAAGPTRFYIIAHGKMREDYLNEKSHYGWRTISDVIPAEEADSDFWDQVEEKMNQIFISGTVDKWRVRWSLY